MKANPVRNPINPRHPLMKRYDRIPSPFSLISKFRVKSTMPILIILGLLTGGSVSFAAENTIPGDALFPVKVYINESVRGAVAVSSQAKAEWELRLIERRLQEVEKLAVEPEASTEAKDTAQRNLEKYTERVKERISRLEDEDNSEDALIVAEHLTEVLREHESILNALDEDLNIDEDEELATTTPSIMVGVLIDGISGAEKKIEEEYPSLLEDAIKTLREAREYSEERNREIKERESSRREEKNRENEEPLSLEAVSIGAPFIKKEAKEEENRESSRRENKESKERGYTPFDSSFISPTTNRTHPFVDANTFHNDEDGNDSIKNSEGSLSEDKERDND